MASSEMSIAIVSRAPAGQPQREPAVVAEAIEQAAARVQRRGRAVLPLIEEQARLLSPPQIHVVLDPVLGDDHRLGHLARQHVDALLQAFEQPRARIVARENAARLQPARQASRRRRQQAVHALRQRLDDEIVAVPIDDERRQQVGFAVNQPIGGRVDVERPRNAIAASIRCRRSASIAGGIVAVGEHADGNLRSVAVERVAERAAARLRTGTRSPGSARTSTTSAR